MKSEIFKRIKSVAKHLLITVGSGVIIVLVFFFIYLPVSTNHGETITVPDVTNQHYTDLDKILISRSLRYEVNADSGYSAAQEPLTVLDQFPKANAKVKENRKIYVTLNAKKPPLVRMPDLIDKSLKIAHIILKSHDLKFADPTYVPDNHLNVILDQQIAGKQVLEGDLVPKGSVVKLFVGDGRGNRHWKMYKYTEQSIDEAKIAIIGAGLKIGTVTHVASSEAVIKTVNSEGIEVDAIVYVSIGEVVKQQPAPGRTVKLKDVVDLWVYQPSPISNEDSILELEN